jgi:uncharacterized repeat protein (TIGR03803 family)
MVFLIALAMFLTVSTLATAGNKTYQTLHAFQRFGGDGWYPFGLLAADEDGNLYGTTTDNGQDGGTIFKLTAPKTQGGKWEKTLLYAPPGGKYQYPVSVVIGPDGVLYGTGAGLESCGFIWSLAPSSGGVLWTYNVLYTLNGTTDGCELEGSLVSDAEGNYYGATGGGGNTNLCFGGGCGVVFELKRPMEEGGNWSYEVLYAFNGTPDSQWPLAGVTFDQDGNLWGTTYRGGTNGWGSVYELSPQQGGGWTNTVIYSFDQSNENIISPEGPVSFDRSGNVYGTTLFGGSSGYGVVFQLLSPNWAYNNIYEFHNFDGRYPEGAILFDSAGNLYSTTSDGGGGTGDSGVAFQLTRPSNGRWTETVLHRFKGPQGNGPNYGFIWGKWGDLYGMSIMDGPLQYGTVFEVSP